MTLTILEERNDGPWVKTEKTPRPKGRTAWLPIVAVPILMAGISPAQSQTVPEDPGPFAAFRYDEDYQQLADPDLRTGWLDELKYIPLSHDPNFYLSLGGEVRERYEHYTNENFGLVGAHNEDYLLSRTLMHFDLHLGKYARTFVQFSSEEAPGREFKTPVDRDDFDFAQAFLDLTTSSLTNPSLTFRSGRQEIVLGSGRFIDVREGPNTRQSHDGFRLFATFADGARLDFFLFRPVLIKSGVFDDQSDPHQIFGGAYGTLPISPKENVHLDGYYYFLRTEKTPFTAGAPTDTRHTVGSRLWGGEGGWDYDIDLLFQFGSQGHHQILAGGVAAKAGYTLSDAWWRPRFGLQADYFSGGEADRDGTASSFNPLFPRGAYFSEPGLQAFENLIDVYPTVTLNPIDTVAIMSGVDFAWRATNRDSVYITPNVPMPGTDQSSGSYIGTSFVLQASWTATKYLSLNGSYVHLLAGPAITNANGKDVDYVALWSSLRF